MSYFFVSLIEIILPISILISLNWAKQDSPKIKPIFFSTISVFLLGMLLANYAPKGQIANLYFIIFCFISLALYALSYSVRNLSLAYCANSLLLIIAGYKWAKNPNLSAVTDVSVLNTEFILNVSAIVFAFILTACIAYWLIILIRQMQNNKNKQFVSLVLMLIFAAMLIIPMTGELQLVLIKLQSLELTKERLSYIAKVTDIPKYYNYISCTILLIAILFFTLSEQQKRKTNYKQTNDPIKKRISLANVINGRRIIIFGLSVIAIIFATQLYWKEVASQPYKLSEAEVVSMQQDRKVLIPVNKVKDGKLHRYSWVASDGKVVRFFIINRYPERLSFAVVFDACLLCGDDGYIMQDNQVICVACDVRIFIPSIGKPGGCNPVPIDGWSVDNDNIVINQKDLEKGLNLFTKVNELKVFDPVNNTELLNTTAKYRYNYRGITYFFSSEENYNLFYDDPEQYIQQND